MKTKICTKCAVEKELTEFCLDNRLKKTYKKICRKCSIHQAKLKYYYSKKGQDNSKKWRKNNKEKISLYKKNNKERINLMAKKWRDKVDYKSLSSYKKNQLLRKKQRYEMKDYYLKMIICQRSKILKPKDIPKDLVEIKRIQVKIHREIRR